MELWEQVKNVYLWPKGILSYFLNKKTYGLCTSLYHALPAYISWVMESQLENNMT